MTALPEGQSVPEGRKMGPIEASFRARAIEARRRLRGKEPHMRPLMIAPPAVVTSPPVVSPRPRVVTTKARELIVEVAKAHGITWRELISPSRERRVLVPRNEAAFRLIIELGLSYPKAGRVLGNRDHTTVLYACRRHAQTSPEAAEIWRQHVECETGERAHKKQEALRRVKPRTWFPPLSTLPTVNCCFLGLRACFADISCGFGDPA
jgi:hypothetical protein